MHSRKAYENDCLNLFIELNSEQIFDFSDLSGTIKQLDVFLINELHLWIESNNDNTLGNQYKIGNAKRSDLPLHMTTEIILLPQIAVPGIRELGVNCMLCCNTCVENNEREGVIRCRA